MRYDRYDVAEKLLDVDFIKWVCSRKAHSNPRGHFIRDTRDDPRFTGYNPEGYYPPERLSELFLNACPEAVRAGVKLLREYNRSVGLQG